MPCLLASAFVFAAVLVCSCTTAGTGSGSPMITLGGPDSEGVQGLVETASENRAFVLGEIHGFAENYEIALRLFKALNAGAGYNVLALEVSFTDADSLNEYIERGNEFRLKDTSLFRNASAGNSEEHFEFFRKLRAYWLSRPPERRFSIWGLDLCDTFPWVVRGHVTGRIMSMEDGRLKDVLLESVPKGSVLGEEQVAALEAKLKSMLGAGEGPKGAKELLFFLGRLVDCFKAGKKWWESSYGSRDRIWMEFARFHFDREKTPGDAKIFVFCGARHARKRGAFLGEAVFAQMLSREIPGFEGRVFSALAYPLAADGVKTPKTMAALGRTVAGKSVRLFDCREAGSPLEQDDSYPLILSRPEPRALSDFYDAVILFRKGTAVTRRK